MMSPVITYQEIASCNHPMTRSHPIELLRTTVAIAELGASQGGRRAQLTQSAISAQVKRLATGRMRSFHQARAALDGSGELVLGYDSTHSGDERPILC